MNYINSNNNNTVSFGVIYDGTLIGERFTDFNKLLSNIRSFSEMLTYKGYETFVIFAVFPTWFKQTPPMSLSTLYLGVDWQKIYDNLINENGW